MKERIPITRQDLAVLYDRIEAVRAELDRLEDLADRLAKIPFELAND